MKKIFFAGLVMICISATASAQKVTEKPVQKDRIEKTFKKGEGGKFDKSKFGKGGIRHKMWKGHARKNGFARKYGNRKMHGMRFRKGNGAYNFKYKGARRKF